MEKLDTNILLTDSWLGKPVTKHIKEFGFLIGAIFLLLGSAKFYTATNLNAAWALVLIGFFLAVGGIVFPSVIRPIWVYWMKFALALGTVMTFVMVTLAWVIMFIPIGLIFKLIGKKTLDLSFKSTKTSYWEPRDDKSNDFKLLDRQY